MNFFEFQKEKEFQLKMLCPSNVAFDLSEVISKAAVEKLRDKQYTWEFNQRTNQVVVEMGFKTSSDFYNQIKSRGLLVDGTPCQLECKISGWDQMFIVPSYKQISVILVAMNVENKNV